MHPPQCTAKANLWRHQKQGDILIVPESLTLVLEAEKNKKVFAAPISKEYFSSDSIFNADHFRQNFGTVLALAEFFALPNKEEIIQKTAQNFTGLPYRCEFFHENSGRKFYDDSISTNPNSAVAAIRFFDKKLGTIIFGGEDAGGTFEGVFMTFVELGINPKLVIVDSEITPKILSAAKETGFSNFEIFDDFEKAVKFAVEETPLGKVCVLSPAGKSFDRFPNYKVRGETFKRIVRAMSNK